MPSWVDKCLTQTNVMNFFRTKLDVLEQITFVSHKLFLIKADIFSGGMHHFSLQVWDHFMFWAKDRRSEQPKWVIRMFKSDTYLFSFFQTKSLSGTIVCGFRTRTSVFFAEELFLGKLTWTLLSSEHCCCWCRSVYTESICAVQWLQYGLDCLVHAQTI